MSTPLALLVVAFCVMALWALDNERRVERAKARRAERLAALTGPHPIPRR